MFFSSIQKTILKESNEHEIIFNSQYMISDKQLRQIESENQISYERFNITPNCFIYI